MYDDEYEDWDDDDESDLIVVKSDQPEPLCFRTWEN
jgi:hypothetical protein